MAGGGTHHVLAARELGRRLPQTLTNGTQHVASVRGHLNPAFCCAFDRTGERVATGSDDFNVKLWSSRTGVLQHVLRGHRGEITDLAISADNTQLASASNDGTIRLWRLRDGVPILSWEPRTSRWDIPTKSGLPTPSTLTRGRAAWLLCVGFTWVSPLDPADYEKPSSARLPPRWAPPSAGVDRHNVDGAAGPESRRRSDAAAARWTTRGTTRRWAAGWPFLFMGLDDARGTRRRQRAAAGLRSQVLASHRWSCEVTKRKYEPRLLQSCDRLLSAARRHGADLAREAARVRPASCSRPGCATTAELKGLVPR